MEGGRVGRERVEGRVEGRGARRKESGWKVESPMRNHAYTYCSGQSQSTTCSDNFAFDLI